MTPEILVLNAGSSSIKVSLFAGSGEPELCLSGQIEAIGVHPRAFLKKPTGELLENQQWPAGQGPADHQQALAWLVERLEHLYPGWRPRAVGHRVVHGGVWFRQPLVIDPEVLHRLEELIPLAPLHQPHNVRGIEAAQHAYPQAQQVACFDTAFHQGHPFVADAYALPRSLHDQGLRRYGFHGLSYEYIARELEKTEPTLARGRTIVAHLGNGASLCALQGGKSVDSTMGFTPLDGLVMGTRTGQIDPGVLLHLLEQRSMNAQELTRLLYFESGLRGLSGLSSDMRDLLASDRPEAAQAVDCFIYRLLWHVGALTAILGGLDGLVFTAGIGENSAVVRERVCRRLGWLGIELDETANVRHARRITLSSSRIPVLVLPTNEEKLIALHVRELAD